MDGICPRLPEMKANLTPLSRSAISPRRMARSSQADEFETSFDELMRQWRKGDEIPAPVTGVWKALNDAAFLHRGHAPPRCAVGDVRCAP